jgi:hypothetical protein
MYTHTSTLLRIFDRPEILATFSNNFPANSCFGREHNFDTLERRDLLNLQEDDDIVNNAHNLPRLLIMKYITSFFYSKQSDILSQLQKQLHLSIVSHRSTSKWKFVFKLI